MSSDTVTDLKHNARKYDYEERAYYPLATKDNPQIGPFIGVKDVVSGFDGPKVDAGKGVVIGTIRMGYGHYRIAIAMASAAHATHRSASRTPR